MALTLKPKILALSYAFPPMAYPRSIQVARLLSGMAASVTVICGEDINERQDKTISSDVEKSIEKIIRIKFCRNRFLKLIDSIFYRMKIPWANVPDIYRSWVNSAFMSFIKWQKESGYNPDILITFGQPMSDHIFGLKLKKNMSIPWIAHFSDPWSDNPYRTDNFVTFRINREIEKKVITQADGVIFTSQETLDLVMKKYSEKYRRKAFVLPHCYDSDIYDLKTLPPQDRYILRYIGGFYGNRSPVSLFKAIEFISDNDPKLLENVIFEFVGSIDNLNKALLSKYPKALKYVSIKKAVSYLESIKLIQSSHCLLVIDAPSDFSVFFPSKLADYIGSGRFIFAITPRGTSERIVKEIGGLTATPQDVKVVVKALKRILIERPERLSISRDIYESFSNKKVVENFKKIIDKTLYAQ